MLIQLGITARKDNICLLHRYLLERIVLEKGKEGKRSKKGEGRRIKILRLFLSKSYFQ